VTIDGLQTAERVLVEDVAHELYALLNGTGATVAVAESCTGGSVTDAVTDVAGCSDYFVFGTVVYANQAKIEVLGVEEETLERHGAVSAEVAEQMARGARDVGHATYAVSTTGIAGPTGATLDKPVGLVYVGLAGPRGSSASRYEFAGNRRSIKEQAARAALDALVRFIRRDRGNHSVMGGGGHRRPCPPSP